MLRKVWVAGRSIHLAALVVLLAACSSGPGSYTKTVSRAATDTDSTFLARRTESLGDPHDGRSGIRLISDGPESLALRLVLAGKAERTIDEQYYLLQDDTVGHLFAWQLLQAAERGVRVRLLLDDIDVSGYDAMVAGLDRHPNIDIRLFNPFARGFGKNVASLLDFERINRRMHNKSMTFDNVVTIVGGRNIGSEYFAAREDSNYDDVDVLGAGPVAKEVSRSFDDYWNSLYAVPASVVVGEGGLTLDQARARLSALAAEARQTPFGDALASGIRDEILRRGFDVQWVPARVVADPPEKAAGAVDSRELLGSVMLPYVRNAETELLVASAYFVPRERGVSLLSDLSRKGVDVAVLTNSIDSTDVLPVYGHYARSREEMLEAGVALWELRPDSRRDDRERMGLGMSQSSLHAKAFAIDREILFVGSFNWDPRSVRLNSEMGVLIESPDLAEEAVAGFLQNLPRNAYRLELDDDGDINWLTKREDGTTVLYRNEPSSSGWRRFMSGFYALLPIGGLL